MHYDGCTGESVHQYRSHRRTFGNGFTPTLALTAGHSVKRGQKHLFRDERRGSTPPSVWEIFPRSLISSFLYCQTISKP